MIWLTLRQFRVQAAAVFGGLAVLGVFLAATGPGLADDYGRGLASCTAQHNCDQFGSRFFSEHWGNYGVLVAIIIALPGLIGVFWGAPLITRELETGTHRLVWNQSITRTRWLAVKLGLVGLSAMVAAGIAVLALSWWADPLDKAGVSEQPRITPLLFGAHGVVPIGYAGLAFVLGVTAGVLTRRTLPAMAITLAVFAAVQVVTPLWIRPHLVPPKSATVTITQQNLSQMTLDNGADVMEVQTSAAPGAWTIENRTVDASGHEAALPPSLMNGACAPAPPEAGHEPPPGPPEKCFTEIARLGFKQKVVYQPADRFWLLQWAETGLFAVLALGLSGLCFYWTRRRLS
ncbi:ABC transporter permease [Actinomadura darangshiensis]|uniref:ABC transporter permease n=1 Tax=Actinomadura darangshiensis TaxID=705336 RepID=A0A4R5BFJ0_9ACTN|nr:ABC transporter permease [Actinomadura darangshiensis]TDD84043.1 ABC transporter permease [Actinomadura darangshiensis]